MLTMKRIVAQAGVGVAGVVLLVTASGATPVTDRAASIVVYPKVVVDSVAGTDTIIQLSNANPDGAVNAHCFYVNANSHCTNTGLPCRSGVDCGGIGACMPGWSEIDFDVVLTRDQPFFWVASVGRGRVCANAGTCEPLPLNGVGVCDNSGFPCTSNGDCDGGGICLGGGESNAGTNVPPVSEDPFVGELKCIQVDGDGNPVAGDALLGNATLVTALGGTADAQEYNAVGLAANGSCVDDPAVGCTDDSGCATGVCSFNGDQVLFIGGEDVVREYQSCPSTLVLDHVFDGAPDPIDGAPVVTDLTLVPCTENFQLGASARGRSTAQFLVFNEFEQRFSTSLPVDCFEETLLSNIDTRNNRRSIFSVNVSGTVAGQSRIRPVGSGLLGVARVMKLDRAFPPAVPGPAVIGFGAAYNLHDQGERNDAGQEDTIVLP